MTDTLPIHHMASCARSGETLVLKTMSAHPDVYVPMNLSKEENLGGTRLVREIRETGARNLRKDRLTDLGVQTEASVILVKQGVWEHPTQFSGFVLVRNPVAVYASLKTYDDVPFGLKKKLSSALKGKLKKGEDSKDRMVRWLRDIDPTLRDYVKTCDFDDAFCAFYTRRMAPLANLGLPIVHYESFVKNPTREVKRICDILKIEYRPELLSAHTAYRPGTEGHGKNDLGKPISGDSLEKYRKTVDKKLFDKISALTHSAWSAFGYRMSYGNVTVS